MIDETPTVLLKVFFLHNEISSAAEQFEKTSSVCSLHDIPAVGCGVEIEPRRGSSAPKKLTSVVRARNTGRRAYLVDHDPLQLVPISSCVPDSLVL